MEPSFSPAVDIEKVKGKETGVIKSKSIVHGIFFSNHEKTAEFRTRENQ
jgi:hypothetical protein